MRVVVAANEQSHLVAYLKDAGHEVKELFVNELAPQVCLDFQADAVLYFEELNGIKPHEDVLKELAGVTRVILVADKENSLIPYAAALGVKDFVFLPTEPAVILDRLENPGTPESAASLLRKAKSDKEKTGAVGERDYLTRGFGVFEFIRKKRCSDEALNSDKPPNKKGIKRSFLFGRKAAIIVAGDYIEGDWSPTSILDVKCDAVVIPAKWGIKTIREIRRDPHFLSVPILVVKGNKNFLRAGADMCVRRITPEIIEQAMLLSRRYKELWKKAETDPLTGLYTKQFIQSWLSEQEHKTEPCFSLAILDIDKFKTFNDTYGHQEGDAVLASFGAFLKSQTRAVDVAARYGGEEFVIGLPNTPAAGARVLVDRLRENWSRRDIILPSGEKVKCTFSAGVARYERGKDIIAEADRFLYKAKSEGRNRVEGTQTRRPKVLLLGQKASSLAPRLLEQGLDVATDPAEAAIIVADVQGFGFATAGKPLVILGTGTIADFAIRKSRSDAKVVKTPEDVVDALFEMLEKPKLAKNLKVFPGGRSEKGQSLALHSALYVVCPSRPGQAGEAAARLAGDIEDCALVCAAPESTGALALGIAEGDLICSDWRIPGSDAPMKWGGVTVWPVDPFKFLNVKDVSAYALVEQIKPKFNLVVVDCAGNLEIVSRAPKADGVIVLHKEGDAADAATSYWLKNYAGSNVSVMSPSEVPDVLSAENGFIMVKRRAGSAEGNIK